MSDDIRLRGTRLGGAGGRWLVLAAALVVGPAGPAAAQGRPAATISPAWDRPEPNRTHFTNPDGTDCGPAGEGGDTLTDLRKNRTDEPPDSAVHPVTFDAIARLSYPRNRLRSRTEWSAADLAAIARVEGVAVSVTAFLAGVTVEDARHSPHGESTNCHATEPEAVDWHVSLVQRPGQPRYRSIVVETTPRVRARHHWDVAALQPSVGSADSVRVTGWLMFDPEHFAQTYRSNGSAATRGKYRLTLWEIHPITKIETFRDGAWADLDSLP